MKDQNYEILRKRNVISILNVLNQEHTISRADLARRTSLTPATVSNLIDKLEKSNIVKLIGQGESTGGRKPILLQYNPDAFYLAGVDIGLAKVIALITDLHGNILYKKKNTFTDDMSREQIIESMISAVHEVFSQCGPNASKVRGIGMSYPGLVDLAEGTGLVAPNKPDINNLPVKELFEREFSLYSCIENDGACMTIGQARFGAGRGSKNILGILLGYGTGSGIIINGELYRGLGSTAGEFGHITVNPNGPTCGCGNQGCLEVMASGAAVELSAKRLVQTGRDSALKEKVNGNIENMSAKLVAECALEGDEIAKNLMLQAANYIGIALADAINMLDPQLVIFGGGMSQSGDYFLEAVKDVIQKRSYVFGLNRAIPRFVLADFGEDMNAVGAAALVLENTLETG